MNVSHNGLEVKVRLQPTVREINRPEKKTTSAVPPVRKSGRFPRVAQVLAIAEGLRQEGKTVLITSHDPRITEAASVDRVVTMADGRIVGDGS